MTQLLLTVLTDIKSSRVETIMCCCCCWPNVMINLLTLWQTLV